MGTGTFNLGEDSALQMSVWGARGHVCSESFMLFSEGLFRAIPGS
jgi:hypothetical protein